MEITSQVINDMAIAVQEIGGSVFTAAWHSYKLEAEAKIIKEFASISKGKDNFEDSFYNFKAYLRQEYCGYAYLAPPKEEVLNHKWKNNIFYSSETMINVIIGIEARKMDAQGYDYLFNCTTGMLLLDAFSV